MATTELTGAPERADHPAIAGFRPAPTQPGLSQADDDAHALSTYVRRAPESTPDLPPLPVQPAARRRAIALRGW